MKIEGTPEEFKKLFNIENIEIKIDGEKVGKLITPSISKELAKNY